MDRIIAGILPGLIWTLFFILIDRKKCRRKYKELIILFIIGGIGSYICYRLEMHFGSYFKKTKNSNYWEILFYAIFGVAIFEEGYKWFITLVESFREQNKEKYDVLYHSIVASIGFATIENVLYYAIPYGSRAGLVRFTTAFLSHIINALWMGYFLEKAFQSNHKRKIFYIMISLLVATIIHGIYNSFLYGEGKYHYFFPYYYIILILSVIIFMILIKKNNKRKKCD